MRFDERHMVIITSLNKDEAKAFIKFLLSEKYRHEDDIKMLEERIALVKERFNI